MYLLLSKQDATTIGDLMLGQEDDGVFGPAQMDATAELSNQIFSSFTTAFTAATGMPTHSAPAKVADLQPEGRPAQWETSALMMVELSIEGKAPSSCALVIPESLRAQIARQNLPVAHGAEAVAGAELAAVPARDGFVETAGNGAASPAFPAGRAHTAASGNIDMLLDVDLDVTIELGRSTLSIKRILELAPGAIVELDRLAGEPVDLMVNNKVVAKGEVVVIEESFGIRILSLLSPEERIMSLR